MNKIGIGIITVVVMTLVGINVVQAGVDINVGIGIPAPVVVEQPAPYSPPPVYEAPAPPAVFVIPGTYVYSVPDPRFEIFFYHGTWWRHDHGRWFTARDYNRQWVYVRPERVPMAVVHVPHDYRQRIRGGQRIEHRDLQANWNRWEREKHWDRHEDHRDYRDRHDHDDRHDDRRDDRDHGRRW